MPVISVGAEAYWAPPINISAKNSISSKQSLGFWHTIKNTNSEILYIFHRPMNEKENNKSIINKSFVQTVSAVYNQRW